MNYQSYEITNWRNLKAIMDWNTQTHSLEVLENPKERTLDLIHSQLPSIAVKSLNSDKVRKVTEVVAEMLDNLQQVVTRSKCQVAGYNSEVDLIKCATNIRIFIDFWKDPIITKIRTIIATGEAEAQGKWLSRNELVKLKKVFQEIIENKEIPAAISFTPHIGPNSSGVFISEAIIVDRNSNIERKFYRLNSSGEECNRASFSVEVHPSGLKPDYHEKAIIVSHKENGLAVRIRFLPEKCEASWEKHDCPVSKARDVVEQLLGEIQPTKVVVDSNREEFVKKIVSSPYRNNTTLFRPHPFFAATKA